MKSYCLMINVFLMLFGTIFSVGAVNHGLRIPGPGCFPFAPGILLIFLSQLTLIIQINRRKDEIKKSVICKS